MLGSYDEKSGLMTMIVFVNPLVNWLWIGGIVMVLGTVIVMSPTAAEQARAGGGAGGGGARPRGRAAMKNATQSEIEEALTCQCGCGLTVHSCNHVQCPSGIPLKEEIAAQLAAGKTRAEVLTYFSTQVRREDPVVAHHDRLQPGGLGDAVRRRLRRRRR